MGTAEIGAEQVVKWCDLLVLLLSMLPITLRNEGMRGASFWKLTRNAGSTLICCNKVFSDTAWN